MDKDRVIGSAKPVSGKVEDAAGKAVGDVRLGAEGKTEGEPRNAIGGMRDALRGKWLAGSSDALRVQVPRFMECAAVSM